MRYTTNYELPLFDADDRIQRQDFNEGSEKTDAALAALHTSALKMVAGTHIGTGGNATWSVTLDFQPKVLILFCVSTSFQNAVLATPTRPYKDGVSTICEITANGFFVRSTNDCSYNSYGVGYEYIALG